jgi:hypothetical protein
MPCLTSEAWPTTLDMGIPQALSSRTRRGGSIRLNPWPVGKCTLRFGRSANKSSIADRARDRYETVIITHGQPAGHLLARRGRARYITQRSAPRPGASGSASGCTLIASALSGSPAIPVVGTRREYARPLVAGELLSEGRNIEFPPRRIPPATERPNLSVGGTRPTQRHLIFQQKQRRTCWPPPYRRAPRVPGLARPKHGRSRQSNLPLALLAQCTEVARANCRPTQTKNSGFSTAAYSSSVRRMAPPDPDPSPLQPCG